MDTDFETQMVEFMRVLAEELRRLNERLDHMDRSVDAIRAVLHIDSPSIKYAN